MSALQSNRSTLTHRRRSADPASKDPKDVDVVQSDPAQKSPSTKATKAINAGVVPPPSPRSEALLKIRTTPLDILVMILLLSAAAAVRLYRLAHIQKVIFDEVHYFNFTNHILNREYFFDVNPVFGKVAIAFMASLFGYTPDVPKAELGQVIKTSLHAFSARLPSVIFGSLTVPIFYRVCRMLHLSTPASIVAASFILFDGMHIVQSRIIMVDSALVFFTCASLYFALYLWQAKNVVVIKKSRVSLSDAAYVTMFLILAGVFCGLSVSVRWTAFATPVVIFTISFFGIGPFCLEPLNVIELLVLYGSAFLSYCATFAVFLLQVNNTGPGDNFMTPAFQSCIIGNPNYTGPDGCKMSLWKRIWEVNVTIYTYSKGIRGKDKWGSSWFQWIINWRGALYYRQVENNSNLSIIYLLMNPMMVVSIDAFMLVFVVALFFVVRYRKTYFMTDALKQHLRRGGALFFGWVASMLPTMVVYRSGPVYQYLPGLFFAQALAAVGFDLIPRPGRPIAAMVVIGLVVAAFWYWSPWVYGFPLSQAEHVQRRWLKRWD